MIDSSPQVIWANVIWSKVARSLHWIVATCIVVNLIDRGDLRDLHEIAGYVAISAVLLRILYGFGAGFASFRASPKSHSRFSNWLLKPTDLVDFLKSEISKKPRDYVGHNPAASWTYVFIWILVACLAISGFMMGLDEYFGEDWLEELHESFSNGVIALVVLHFLGIAKDSFTRKRQTWKAMINGRR